MALPVASSTMRLGVALLAASTLSWGGATAAAERVIRGRAVDQGTAAGAESTDDLTKLHKQLKEVLAKQEEILANQAVMLQKFDAVMEELRIIKVRATLRGS